MTHLFKSFCLLVCLVCLSATAHAQDKIYKKDGTEIDAKVISVGVTSVVYKRFDNLDGPEYTILESDIAKIVYPNGKADTFDGMDKEPSGKRAYHNKKDLKDKQGQKYGKNIFSVIPVAYTSAADQTINDVGVGISYERTLDKYGHLGFNIPVLVSFSSATDYNNGFVSVSGNNVTYGHYTSVYFMPGIKYYPAPERKKVRYSVGASFFCIFGGEPAAVYDQGNTSLTYNPTTGSYSYPTGTYHYAMYGLMISNSINMAATKHMYMALDLGAGIPVSDNRYNNGNEENLGIPSPFIQLGFKVGYRYGS